VDEKKLSSLLLVQGALIGAVVLKIRESDPNFETQVANQVDQFFGMQLAETGLPNPIHAEARAMLDQLLKSIGQSEISSSKKRLTWRRRFLNWLERG
jgi:hypothetical protein